MTPEGAVKAAINRVIDEFKGVYKFMPVPSGYGLSTLDYVLCANGIFIGIEAKAPGKVPTKRQQQIISQIRRAGGIVFVIDRIDDTERLHEFLEANKVHATSAAQLETQDVGGALLNGGEEPLSDGAGD